MAPPTALALVVPATLPSRHGPPPLTVNLAGECPHRAARRRGTTVRTCLPYRCRCWGPQPGPMESRIAGRRSRASESSAGSGPRRSSPATAFGPPVPHDV